MSVYTITDQIEYDGKKVAVIIPDHISLGKCVTCHNFVRKYASINDIEIHDMLCGGVCRFHGFKKIRVESSEEEGFAHMHFVLLLSSNESNDLTREVCVRRISTLNLKFESSVCTEPNMSEAITDSSCCVVILCERKTKTIRLFHFNRNIMRKFTMEYEQEVEMEFVLMADILYIQKGADLLFINFGLDQPFMRTIKILPNQELMLCSTEMVVLIQKDIDEKRALICDTLQKDATQKLLIPPDEILNEFIESNVTVLRIQNKFIWIVCGCSHVSLYTTSLCLDKPIVCAKVSLNSLFPESEQFIFSRSCYCASTNQAFLLYTRTVNGMTNSTVLVLDMHSLSVTALLQLQLTVNRTPQIVMHASRSGHKLFVQETFENKVIFYQVFKLLPAHLRLQNIVKQFIWQTISEGSIDSMKLPKHLKDELRDGF